MVCFPAHDLKRTQLPNPACALALMAACVLATSCAPGDASDVGAGASDSLYIGVAAAVTTATSPYFDGVSLAVDRLNAERPSGTRPFAIRRPPDDQSTQVSVAVSFRDDASVIGVVGHTGSAQTLEAAPVYGDVEGGGRRAVVAISPTATNPRATRTSEWVFRVCPTDADGATRLARFASDSLGSRHVAVLYRNDLFGRGFVRVFVEALRESAVSSGPGAVAVDRYPYLAGITEYEAYAADIAARGASVVVIAGGGEDATDIMRAIRRAGTSPAFLGTDDVAGLGTGPLAGEFRGLRYIAFFLAGQAPAGASAEFVNEYRRRYGRLPDHRAALSYDAATLIGRAALAVGSDRRRIRDWVANVGRDAPPFEGITGQIRFDEWGDPSGKPVLLGEVQP